MCKSLLIIYGKTHAYTQGIFWVVGSIVWNIERERDGMDPALRWGKVLRQK